MEKKDFSIFKKTKWLLCIAFSFSGNAFADIINYGNIFVSSSSTSLVIGSATTINIFNSGWAEVSGGDLIVNGTLNGMTTSTSGGRLSGTGTLNMWGYVLNQGGSVMPGSTSAIGQLTINGDYLQTSGGTLLIPISASGGSVLQVNGTAALNGTIAGTLVGNFIPSNGNTYTVLRANSISGQFSTLGYVTPTLFLNPTYNTDNVVVTISRNYTGNPRLRAILSRNELAIGNTLNVVNSELNSGAVNPDFNTVLTAIDRILSYPAVASAYRSLEPISNDVLLNFGLTDATLKTQALDQYMFSFSPQSIPVTHVTILGVGNIYNEQNQDGLENQPYTAQGKSLVLGIDRALSSKFALGVLAETNKANTNINGNTVNYSNLLVGPYFIYQFNKWYADGLLGIGNNDFNLNRSIQFGTINRNATSAFSATEYLSYVNLAYEYFYKQWQYGPQLSFQYLQLNIPQYQESGAQALNLIVNDQDAKSLRFGLGANILYQATYKNLKITPSLSVTLLHEAINPHFMSMSFLGTANTYTQLFFDRERNFLLFNFGLGLTGKGPWNVNLSYVGQVGRSTQMLNALNVLGTYEIA